MKIDTSDFVKWSPKMAETFHIWEVMIPCGAPGKLAFRQEKFVPEEYERPEEQYEALCDVINGCRFSNTEYYVFCDNKLVMDF